MTTVSLPDGADACATLVKPPKPPNPFSRPVIDGPRDALATAESIHRAELERIVQVFNTLAAQPLPRLQRGPLALLVLSQMPGSGKSHLLGRLWRALNGRATVIFLRAHQDRQAFWRRILERLVQELEYPEAADQRALTPGSATQLDSLARHLLADLLERGIQSGKIKASEQTGRLVRSGSPQAMEQIRKKLPDLMRILDALVFIWMNQLKSAGLQLERDPVVWLKVLICYTLHRPGEPQRSLALAWLQGNELEPEEARQLGLTASQQRVVIAGGSGEDSLNESAFQCVKDLCALSAFFRPVVFAFDQTEIYGQSPELAKAFGATVGRLQAECINQFTVVTGNEQPWLHNISQHFERADLDRFDLSQRVLIKGIDQAQAIELVTVKMQSAGHAPSDSQDFVARPWLAALFANRAARPLPRAVEQAACLALERWHTGGREPEDPTPDTSAVTATDPADDDQHALLERAMEAHRARLLASPKALDFDVGVLLWSLTTGVSRVPDLTVREGFHSAKRKLQICWQMQGRTVYFVLDDSTHWKHWLAVVNSYHEHAEPERHQGRVVRAVALWHRSLKPVGEGMRKQFSLPAAQGLALLDLGDQQMAELYAAQALFADVCQGDMPQVNVATLLAFLGRRLQAWARQTAGLTAPADPLGVPPAEERSPHRTDPHHRTDLHLTVTQLVCACARPGWLASWLIGQAPGTAPQGGDGIAVHGARLHLIAQAFAEWATSSEHAEAATALDSAPKLHARLMALGGDRLRNRLARGGQVQGSDRVNEHLLRLARHFIQSRRDCAGFSRWSDVFLAQEHALRRVPLATHQGRTVWVSGRLDSLRHRHPHAALLVDYKFARADTPTEALLQLALYQRMLIQQHSLKVDGCIEFLGDPSSTLSRSADELAALFEQHVQPVLARLLDMPAAPNPPSTVTLDAQLGVQRHHPNPPVTLPLAALARHSAVLGGTGSGKTTAALHVIEQVLAQGIPAVLLDRKGDLCRYAQPEAWDDPRWPPAPHLDAQRRAELHQRLAIRVYTPGAIQGRGLRLPLAPAGLARLPAEERDQAAQDSASVFAQALGLTRPSDQSRKAVLVRVFQLLARRLETRGIVLDDVLELLSGEDPDLLASIGVLDPKLCRQLAEKVQTFKINSGTLLDERAELLDWAQWFSPLPDGRIPLTIVSTKFLGDDNTLFWVAQFFLELLRHVSRHPADHLQGLLMIDEADLYLPATKAPATKGPLESLLKRARSGGVGLMLCTQSPGDLDYRGRDNIRNWLLGSIREARALEKLAGLLADSRVEPEQLSKQKIGQFVFAAEGRATALDVTPNMVQTQQLSEPDILRVAAQRSGSSVG